MSGFIGACHENLTETVDAWTVNVGDVIESHDDYDHIVVDWDDLPNGKIRLTIEKRGSLETRYTAEFEPYCDVRIVLI